MKNLRLYTIIQRGEFDTYKQLFKHAKHSDTFLGKKGQRLMKMSFGEVQFIRKKANAGDYDKVFSLIFKTSERELLRARAKDFFPCFFYIIHELEIIAKAEDQLSSKPDAKMVQAGVRELDRFGPLNSLISLGQQYGVMPHVLEQEPYQRIFTLLLHGKISHEIDREYHRIK